MYRQNRTLVGAVAATCVALISASVLVGLSVQAPAPAGIPHVVAADDCTTARLGTTIPVSSIGEAVAGVSFAAPRWAAATANAPAYCAIDGSMAPADTSANGRSIN